MPLKLYIDWLSQPSRFVATVFDLLRVPHEIIEVRIGEGKQRTPDFAKINQFRKVPAISDNDFNLAESHTIVKYIIKSRNIQTSLYPLNDVQKTAKIDEYLDYHHSNTRKCSQLFFNIIIAPKLGIETTVNLEQAKKEVESVLKFIDNWEILGKQAYICGKELTLADLSAYCELFQLHMIKYDFGKYPNIQKWSQIIEQLPEIQKSHSIAMKIPNFEEYNKITKLMKLYIDFISQPSRAVKSVFDLLKINYELKTLKVQFKEHQTEEYAKINPLKLVPAIQDGNFLLAESHSIMKYAIRTNNIKTTLYPFDEIQNCARIDEYLDYHHTNTRKCMHLFHNVLISPKLNETIETDTQFVLRDVKKVFEYLNQKLQNQQYLCGNQLTLADISACCEIMQLHMIKFDFAVYPHLDAWLYKVFSVPEIKANHEVALKIIKKQNPDCRYLK